MALAPDRLAIYKGRLSNPGRRSTIPDPYLRALSPGLFAKRQQNRKVTAANRNPAYNPTALLSGNALKNLIHTLAGLELNPQIAAGKQELGLAKANDQALLGRIGGYNQNLANTLAGVTSTARSGEAQLASELGANRQSTLGILQQNRTADQQLEGADTALRGAGLSGGMDQRLAGDYVRQQAGVATGLGAQTNQSLVQAGGWSGLATIMQGAAAMRGADVLSQAATGGANREAGISQKISGLQAQRGPLEAKYLQQTRQSEFEKAATAQTLGIKTQQANTAATKAARIPESTYQKEVAKWATKLGLTPAAFRALPTGRKQALITAYNKGSGKSGKSLDQIAAENSAREAGSHGYTYQEWQQLTPQQRQKIAAGRSAVSKIKNPWLTPIKQNSSISDARKWYATFSSSDYAKGTHGYKETRDHLASIIGSNVAPGILNAITDKYILGHMTMGTKEMLALEGIMPTRIANALGIAIH